MTKPRKEEPQVAQIVDLPDADAEVAKFLQEHIRHTPVGLEYQGEFTFEQWEASYKFYSQLRTRTQWMLGDCIRAGERFGDRYSNAIHITGRSYSDLTTIVSVCHRFSDHKRRRELVSFGTHAACAYLPPQTADELLKKAVVEQWTREDMRKEVAKIEELRGGKKPAKQGKRQSSLPRAANVNEVKEVIDIAPAVKTGLFWDGYQLQTKERLIYRGPDALSEEEAEKAAHHFGLAHWPALANWLETYGFTNPQPRKEGDAPCSLTTKQPPADSAPAEILSASRVTSSGAVSSHPTPAPIPVDPPPWGHALWHYLSVEHGQNLLESELNDILRLAEPLIDARRAALASQSPAVAPEPESPLEVAERALRLFAGVQAEIPWATFKTLAIRKWFSLLKPCDETIDILQKANLALEKAREEAKAAT